MVERYTTFDDVFDIITIKLNNGDNLKLLYNKLQKTVSNPFAKYFKRTLQTLYWGDNVKTIEDYINSEIPYHKCYDEPQILHTEYSPIDTVRYYGCKVCFHHFSSVSIKNHILQCGSKYKKSEFDASDLNVYVGRYQGFSFKSCGRQSSYVIIMPTAFPRYLRPITQRKNIEDVFVKEIALDKFLVEDNKQYIYTKNKSLEVAIKEYLLKSREIFNTSTTAGLLALEHEIAKPYDADAKRVFANYLAPLLFIIGKKLPGFEYLQKGNLVVDAEDEENDDDDERFHGEDPLPGKMSNQELTVDDIKRCAYQLFQTYFAVYNQEYIMAFMLCLHLSFIKTPTKLRNGRQRAYIYDALLLFLGYACFDLAKDESIYLYQQFTDGTRLLNMEKDSNQRYSHTWPQINIVPKYDGSELSIGGVSFSIHSIKNCIETLRKHYITNVNQLLPKGLQNVDKFYTQFCSLAVEPNIVGHGTGAFSSDAMERIRRDVLNEFAASDMPRDLQYYRKLFKLNCYLFFLIQLTVGVPYRISELCTLSYGDYNYFPRNLKFMKGTRQFLLQITHNKLNSVNRRYYVIAKKIPVSVSKLLVHYLLVVRSLELDLFNSNPSIADSPSATHDTTKRKIDRDMFYNYLRTKVFLDYDGFQSRQNLLQVLRESYNQKNINFKRLRLALFRFTMNMYPEELQRRQYEDAIKTLAGSLQQNDPNPYGVTEGQLLDRLNLKVCSSWHSKLNLGEQNSSHSMWESREPNPWHSI